MTTNFVAPDGALELTAPVGGVVAGGAYLIGSLLVIAADTVAAGSKFQGVPKGVFTVPKPNEEDWDEGAKIYWDSDDKLFTDQATSPGMLVGVSVAAVPISVVLATDAASGDAAISGSDITIQAFADLASASPPVTFTVTINGVEHVLTVGEDFEAETSDEVTAQNLADAINALGDALAEVAGDTVTVTALHPSDTANVRLDGVAR